MQDNQYCLKFYCTLALLVVSSLMADAANYLCFTAEEAGSEIGYSLGYSYSVPPDIQYSTDGGTSWNVMKEDEPIVLENIGDKVYFKGVNPYGLGRKDYAANPSNSVNFRMTGRIAASGSVMSLIDGEGTSTRIESEYCFMDLFDGCESLTKAPELPATQLATGCYMSMFGGCTNLVEAPELPATHLASYCYSSMFYGCESLTKVPELPATLLDEFCYDNMFERCTSLVEAPELPATQLANHCYFSMFSGCTSLAEAPELPATQLANYCYFSMFSGCTSLTTAPKLPATQLKNDCYANMFKGCTSLVRALGISATETAVSCCRSMFEECRNLEEAPDLLAQKVDSFSYQSMFKNCSSLKKAPKLPAMELAFSCYEEMFMYCTLLKEAPELPAVELAEYCYAYMFKGCVYLTKAPLLASSELVSHCYYYMLNSCSRLKYIRVGVMSLENPFDATTEWVDGVDGNKGLFVFPCGSTYNVRGASDVPMNFQYISSPLVIFQNPDSTEIWRDTIGCGKTPEYRGETPTYGEGLVFKRWDKKFIAHSDPDIYYYTAVYEEVEKPATGDWLCFTAKEGNSEFWYESGNGNKPDLWYSINEGQDWSPLDSGQVVLLRNVGDRAFLKGYNPDGFTKEETTFLESTHFGMSGRIAASGSVMSLIDGTGESLTIPCDYCFSYLFFRCTSLIKAPNLPATTLTNRCYEGMFQDCVELKDTPKLPATSLKEGCYSSMFLSCENLTYVEGLPATTLAPSCYNLMFGGCSSLVDAPELPALKLKKSCYATMFAFCESMTHAPQLPAIELADYCYGGMFSFSGLTEAPALPVTELKEGCYFSMFRKCADLTRAPELPAVELAESCYFSMFSGCGNLVEAPELPAMTLATQCYESMFADCASLVKAPELPASTLAENCYSEMFSGCSNLNYIKVGVLSLDNDSNATTDWVKGVDSLGIFIFPCGSKYDKHGVSEVPNNFDIVSSPIIVFQNPDGTEIWRDTVGCGVVPEYKDSTPTCGERLVFDGWDKELTAHEEPGIYYYTAKYIKDLSVMGKWLCFTAEEAGSTIEIQNAGTLPLDMQYSLDGGATWNLFKERVPIVLENVDDKVCLRGINPQGLSFVEDEHLRFVWFNMTGRVAASGSVMSLIDGVGESTVIPSDYCFEHLFSNCTSLTEAPELPATTLTESCYEGMFNDCSNLRKAPALPATQLADLCYFSMFDGCVSLEEAPALPADSLAFMCYCRMFAYCENLKSAPSLPATKLAEVCYVSMFQGCANLTEAPALPAMELSEMCYYAMFAECTNLTEAPALPATTLMQSCYENMFNGCASLVRAPELPATQLVESCYSQMFTGCTSLNYIKVGVMSLETDSTYLNGTEEWTTNNATVMWVSGVDGPGTFIFPCGSIYDKRGVSQVPTNFDIRGLSYSVDSVLSACDSITLRGKTFFESGVWNDTLSTMDGCDSIITYHLTIHKGVTTDSTIIAEGSFTWKGTTYTKDASWSDTLQTVNGCDSIVIYHLEIQLIESAPIVVEKSLSACDSFLFKGITYHESGSWSDTLQTVSGGSRILTYHLTIHKSVTVETTILAEGSYSWKGTTYTEDASWSDTLQTVNGCDSIVRYNLVVNEEKSPLQLTVEDDLYLVLPGGSETISYELTGGEGSTYEVRYKDKTLCKGDVTNDSTVALNTPSNLEPGAYEAALVMYDGEGEKAEKNFTFNVMLPDNKQKSYYVKVWNDVVICRNGEGQFLTYQWYKGRKKCEEAAQQFYNDKTLLDGEYMVYVSDKNGKSYFIEPVTYAPVEAAYAITAEPNVVARGTEFTVKVSGVAEEELPNARVVVYRANGVVEKLIDEVELESTMRLKTGEYVIVLTVHDGKNANCKVLVK